MSELEQRQEVLIEKLDILYDRIKTISSYCNVDNGIGEEGKHKKVNSSVSMIIHIHTNNIMTPKVCLVVPSSWSNNWTDLDKKQHRGTV